MSDTPRDVRDLGEVVVVPLSSIKPHPRNPRHIPERAVEAVALSLQRFGWQQPLVVDGDMVLVAGHTRVKAAQSLGLTKVPVIVARDLTPDEIDAFRIADNRTHDFTSWDFPELVSQLEGLSDDFADVLALADWHLIVDNFEKENPEVDVDDEASVQMNGGFQVVVVFESAEAAKDVERELMDMPGVLDIRYRTASS
jgi:hypothetical protein